MKRIMCFTVFLIGFYNSIFSKNPEWVLYNTSNSGLSFNYIKSLAVDSSQNKWIGGKYTNIVNKFDEKNWFSYSMPEHADVIYDIEVDKKGIIWVGHEYGLSKYDDIDWTHFNPGNSQMPSYFVGSIAFDKDGIKLLGTSLCNLIKFDNENWTTKVVGSVMGFSQGQLYAVLPVNNGDIYLGTGSDIFSESFGYFGKCDNDTCIAYWDDISGMPTSDIIHTIISDQEAIIWIATALNYGEYPLSGGLVKFNPGPGDTSWTVYQIGNSGIPNNNVNDVVIDNNDIKWIGTDAGLVKFDDTTWTVWDASNSVLTENKINCIVIDKYDNKWIGTTDGLAVFREGGVIMDVEEAPALDEISVNCYPNPADDVLKININNPAYGYTSVKLFDLFGREMGTIYDDYTDKNLNLSYDTGQLPSGTYFLSVSKNAGRKVERIEVLK